MGKNDDEQPDMKEIENRVKDAKQLLKQLEQGHKELCGVAKDVKQLEEKFS